jgi:DNA-binding transcriptional regulator YiaG
VAKGSFGGRKPGQWTSVTPEKILAFRLEHDVSRARLAAALGVATTTVQNWENGHGVAMPRLQKRLAEILAAGPDGLVPLPAPSNPLSGLAGPAAVGPQVQATSTIVDGYLRNCGRKLTTEELLSLIKVVRGALK